MEKNEGQAALHGIRNEIGRLRLDANKTSW